MHAHSVMKAVALSSGNSKQDILRENPEVKEILRYMYDPYLRYNVSAPRSVYGRGTEHMDDLSFTILDRLATRELSGSEALNVVRNYITGLADSDGEVFKMILAKDARAGISAKTINKVWPGLIPTFDVMLAKPYALISKTGQVLMKRPMIKPGRYWDSPKKDGLRGVNTNGKLYTRNGHEILSCNHIAELLGTGFDGEIMVPGVDFYRSSGFIRDHGQHPDAEYHIFDCHSLDAPFVDRLDFIWQTIHKLGDSRIKLVPHIEISNHTEAIEMYHDHRANGDEGGMIKSYDFKYVGARSAHWLKTKNVDFYTLKVKGSYEGTGKYEGMLGGIIVDFNGVDVRVGTGFSDRERAELMDALPCTLADIHSHEETPDGSLREPRFKGWRFDLA